MVQRLLDPNVGGFKPAVDYPGDNCCFLYDHHHYDYSGEREPHQNMEDRRRKVCHDGSRTEIHLSTMGWDNKTSSYVCGKNVWYDFCNDGIGSNCTGAYRGNSGAGHILNYAIRHLDNAASSVVLGPYDPREIGAVTMFEDHDCSGASARFYWDPDSGMNGTFYNQEDMLYAGLRNDSMNSFVIPKGYLVELYEHPGFNGSVQIVEGAYKDDSEEMVCMKSQYGDTLSSLIVKRQPQGIANAYWQSITTSESSEITYHVGLSYEDQSHSSWEEADRMNAALDLGLTFLSIFIPPLSLIPRQKNVVQRDVTTTYGYEYGYTTTTSCTVPEGSQYGAGLWQWVVSTEDNATMSFTHHTVCRTGELFNREPECPYFACANADCSECVADWQTAL